MIEHKEKDSRLEGESKKSNILALSETFMKKIISIFLED